MFVADTLRLTPLLTVTSIVLRLHIGLPSIWNGKTRYELNVETAREATLPDFEAVRS